MEPHDLVDEPRVPQTSRSRSAFGRFSQWIAHATGRPATFVAAVVVVLAWAFSGPLFGFSDTWQLVINTSTTIVTFLMVFLIQNTQNRDSEALHLKIDELIRAIDGARNSVLDLEDRDEEELEALRLRYGELAAKGPEPCAPASLEEGAVERAITRAAGSR